MKFRCTNSEYQRNFTDDLGYGGIACYTQNEDMVKPWRIGMLGSLVVGVNVGVFKRIKEHPGVFTFGVAETAIGAVGATYCAKVMMQNHKMIFPALAGVFLA